MNTVHVDYPSSYIFLCGGLCDTQAAEIQSLRSAFYKIAPEKPFDTYGILIAEDVSKEFQSRPDTYDNLLSLESDLAQVSRITLLFSESFGSAAELGAFCMEENIASRLLVVISEKYFEEASFVKLGPLKHLKDNYAQSAICVLPREVCNLTALNLPDSSKLRDFKWYVETSINERMEGIETKTTFDKNIRGHIILIISGIVWYYWALEREEIHYILLEMGINIDDSDVYKYIFCATQFCWIECRNIGSHEYYVNTSENSALTFRRAAGIDIRASQWRLDVLNIWRAHDRLRYEAICRTRKT